MPVQRRRKLYAIQSSVLPDKKTDDFSTKTKRLQRCCERQGIQRLGMVVQDPNIRMLTNRWSSLFL